MRVWPICAVLAITSAAACDAGERHAAVGGREVGAKVPGIEESKIKTPEIKPPDVRPAGDAADGDLLRVTLPRRDGALSAGKPGMDDMRRDSQPAGKPRMDMRPR